MALSEEDIDYLFRFVGYGDPKSRLWFVGIEEGQQGGPDAVKPPARSSHENVERDGPELHHDPTLPSGESNRVWAMCRGIAQACGIPSYFMSNIAPVARRNIRVILPGGLDSRAYRQRVQNERVPLLGKLLREQQDRVAVFHGKAGWRTHGVIGQLCDEEEVESLDGAPGVLVCHPRRILLANTFAYGRRWISESDQRAIEHQVDAWLAGSRSGAR
ncbi:hypothetical protein [Coralloluteibacterium stylophorae]|uniref:Uracil-DNA glycosylase-like domain-containing protein n=1 Tax=Coralloluteibacterium stylophorae TaxID=1776034 RepID=A0A8J8AZ36_9GAMM|nr:hypothetical protein [Coralloluteibacterium stylophorae]MBS7455715.1 hypothetical protein [Coralloluteibacterium stylophorae]